VVIFDIETNGVARKLQGHTRQIQSLRYDFPGFNERRSTLMKANTDSIPSWSRDGRYLLTSSQDWKCILWDLKDGSRIRTVRFEAPVYIAELHPFNQYSYQNSPTMRQSIPN
jgi:COMPASS component SWD1